MTLTRYRLQGISNRGVTLTYSVASPLNLINNPKFAPADERSSQGRSLSQNPRKLGLRGRGQDDTPGGQSIQNKRFGQKARGCCGGRFPAPTADLSALG